MICRIAFDYNHREALVAAAQDPAKLPVLLSAFGDSMPAEERRTEMWHWPEELMIDMTTDGVALAEIGVAFVVRKFKGTMPLQAILPPEIGKINPTTVTVYVQVPHVGLLAVDEVELEENCCTDRLQTRLDDGWRILCVCPPNAARRPDYILGRTKERK